MVKSIGCVGCLTICRAIVRKCGSSMRKGLFRNGSRHTVARSSAGQAQASTAMTETARVRRDPSMPSFSCLSPLSFVILFCDRKQWRVG